MAGPYCHICYLSASDVQYVAFPPDDRREPAAVHPCLRPGSQSCPQCFRAMEEKKIPGGIIRRRQRRASIKKQSLVILRRGVKKNLITGRKGGSILFAGRVIFGCVELLLLLLECRCMLSNLHQIRPKGCAAPNNRFENGLTFAFFCLEGKKKVSPLLQVTVISLGFQTELNAICNKLP